MSNATSKTTTRLSANGETEVLHPDMPKAWVRISQGGKGFELYGEEDGCPMHKADGKSFTTPEAALKEARKVLDATAAWRAVNAESFPRLLDSQIAQPKRLR